MTPWSVSSGWEAEGQCCQKLAMPLQVFAWKWTSVLLYTALWPVQVTWLSSASVEQRPHGEYGYLQTI